MRLPLLAVLSFTLSTAVLAAPPSQGPAALSGLSEGQRVSSFTVRALYLGADDKPLGARFVHDSGMPVDLLFFASVPQASIVVKTLPVSESGEPHTLEHLLLGKGRQAKYMNALMEMRLGAQTAATYSDLTNFQMRTVAPDEFDGLLEAYLQALLHPDFTDEEIRREVANFEAAPDTDGRLRLVEKGTVYNEMVSTMQRPDAVNWDRLGRMVMGAEHPLARNAGGDPPAIWKLGPADIRRFHDANYRLGPNMELVVALPYGWSAEDFLSRLSAMFGRLQSDFSVRSYARLPAFQPLGAPDIRIGGFPSDDPNIPQTALLAWKPVPELSREERVRLSILLQLLAGGETSYLYKDLVDQKTRKLDAGATSVSAELEDPPQSYPDVSVGGLPVGSITPEALGRLRDAVLARLRWLSELRPGTAELKEAAERSRSLLAGARRASLKFMDSPPQFGTRGNGVAWHRLLDQLAAEEGFRKSVSMKEIYGALESELDAGRNPWTRVIDRGGLLTPPYVSAVKPDPALLAKEKSARDARAAVEEARLQTRYGAPDAAEALRRFRVEADSGTRILEALDAKVPRPAFVADPPLTLDEFEHDTGTLRSGPTVLRAVFGDTPFTTVSLRFDLSGVPAKDLELLPFLAPALTGVGVVTREDEPLDYAQAQDRIRSEIAGFSADTRARGGSGRVQLELSATASTPEEIPKAVVWLENYLTRATLEDGSRKRLVDVARNYIQAERQIFEEPEEDWVESAAKAYEYQDEPAYMAVESPFTELRDLSRLRWRLEDPPKDELDKLEAALSQFAARADSETYESLSAGLAQTPGELAEYFRFELAHLPPDSWRADLKGLAADTRKDLATPSAETIERLRSLIKSVLVRRGATVVLEGSRRNVETAEGLVDTLLGELPKTGPAAAPAPSHPLVLERLRSRGFAYARPVHVGLVDNGAKTGVHLESAKSPSYASRSRDELLDQLALNVFTGYGPHSFFMRTWAAGLAYSNGIHSRPADGRVRYYAERCPDLVSTMRFVAGVVGATRTADPFFVEYSLANAFSDVRSAGEFQARAEALEDDLEDGRPPQTVRGFKQGLVKLAAEPGIFKAVSERVPAAVGRVIVGLGPKLSEAPGASAFVIGPDELLSRWEAYLKQNGEADRLVRLYPRDFWNN